MTLTPEQKAELKAAAELFGELIVSQTTTKDLLKYVAVAGPTAILDLLSEVERLREALTEIAAYFDTGGNERLKSTGSYSAFDEPGSVEIARAALGE